MQFFKIFDQAGFVTVWALQLRPVGATLQLRYTGCFLRQLLLLQSTGSKARGLQQLWFLDSRAQAPYLWFVGLVAARDVGASHVRMESMSPSLAAKFFTTQPLSKPSYLLSDPIKRWSSHWMYVPLEKHIFQGVQETKRFIEINFYIFRFCLLSPKTVCF